MPRGPLSRVGRERVSNSFRDFHPTRGRRHRRRRDQQRRPRWRRRRRCQHRHQHRRHHIIAPTAVNVAMVPRPPKSPTRSEVPAGARCAQRSAPPRP
eukprot:350195-Pyramimonas_sp.AAC.1